MSYRTSCLQPIRGDNCQHFLLSQREQNIKILVLKIPVTMKWSIWLWYPGTHLFSINVWTYQRASINHIRADYQYQPTSLKTPVSKSLMSLLKSLVFSVILLMPWKSPKYEIHQNSLKSLEFIQSEIYLINLWLNYYYFVGCENKFCLKICDVHIAS